MNQLKKIVSFAIFFLSLSVVNAQTTINNYAKVLDIPACNPCLGDCDRLEVDDASPFAIGDVIMIIQVKGGAVNLSADTTFGDVLSYGAVGFHEKNSINNIIGNTIYLGAGLSGAYDPTQSLQIVSVPQFPAGYTVPVGGITCPAWDGNTGGVIALDVVGTLDLQGDIDARGKGLRGGNNPNSNFNEVFCGMKGIGDWYFDGSNLQVAGRKGEGIAEWILPTYELGRGKWANGGGGGHNHNAGGGGGSNMGRGGHGGHEYANLGCGSVTFIRNGVGGQALDPQGGLRMFMGGGGGAGQENNNVGNSGGNGGGIIIISADRIEGNGFWIRADGDKGINYAGVQDGNGRNDGGGGGGAGGSIKLECNDFGGTNLTISSEGADGGSLDTRIHGPGGGGGGGLICSSIASFPGNVSVDVTGGLGGITTGDGTNFGSEAGDDGTINASCTPPSIPPLMFSVNIGSDVNLCSPPSHIFDTRLSATNTFTWYKDGVVIPGATDPTYEATSPGVYVVETGGSGCPLAYDTATVTTDGAIPTDAYFCGTNQNVDLEIAGPGGYAWFDDPVAGNRVGVGDIFTTPPISGTTTYYAEDTSVFNYIVGEPASGHGLSQGFGEDGIVNPDRLYLQFDALSDFTLDAVTLAFKAWWINPGQRFNATVSIYDNTGALVQSITDANINPGTTGNVPAPNIIYARMPLGIDIPQGSNYSLRVVGNGGTQIHWFEYGRNFEYTDPASEVLSIWGTHSNYMPVINPDGTSTPPFWGADSHPGIFDWEISAGIPCARVPVTANYTCVASCENPGTATLSPAGPIGLCASSQTLTASQSGTTPAGGFEYQFYYDDGLGGGFVSVQGPLPSNTYDASVTGDYYVVITDPTDAASCFSISDTVSITIDPVPSTSDAGPAQTQCETTTTATLAGNNPATGTGTWTLVSGSGTITTPTSNTSGVTGLAVGANTFRWTISTGTFCTDETDDVVITLDAAPTASAAGTDQTICGTGSTENLSANIPTVGTGTWTTTAGTGTFGNANNASTTVSGLSLGANTFTWTISEPGLCPDETDDITITVETPPSTANVGPDLNVCIADPVSLPGNNPSVGTGTWTVGASTTGGTIDNPSQFNSNVSAMTGSDVLEAIWTISNGSCPSSVDTVIITATGIAAPSVSLSVNQSNVCEGTPITFTAAGNNEGSSPTYQFFDQNNNPLTAATSTNTYTIAAPTQDTIVYVELISNSSCIGGNPANVSSTNVPVQVDLIPSTADAGPDQSICTDQTALAAVAPTTGTGMWSTVSGSGTVTTPASEVSTVTGLTQGTTLTLQWEVSNGVCPSSTDQVDITRTGALTTPNAGPDQTICESSSATLNANAPQVGESGTWTTSGDGTFDDATSPTAVYTLGTETGSVTLTWTIDNGGLCPAANDDVVITLDPLPTVADAGPARTICTSDFTLEGNPATTGTGMWTTVTGPGTYADPTDENTLVSNLQDGTNQLQWTISSGACPVSSDVVTITKSGDLTSPSAGTDDNICETQTSYTLTGNGANAGNGETGTWTLEAGTATITSPNNPTTDITAMGVGTITMRWTIDNGGVCPDAFDEVNIIVDQDPGTITLDPDTNLCGTSMPLNGTTPVVGTGVWAITGGPGTVTTPTDPSSTITGLSGLTELTWVVTNGTCVQGDAFRITASLPQTPDVILTPSNSSICEGDPITFTATPVGSGNGANPTYEFYENGMSVQGPTTIASYTPLNYTAATGNITVVIRPSITCVDVDSAVDLANANVSSAPFVSIAEPDAQVCITNGYTLTAVTSANTSLQWYDVSSGGPVALFGENSTTLDVPNTGDYIAVVNNNDLSCNAESSDTVEVIIDAMPNVEAGDEQTLFVGESITMTGSVSNAAGGSIWTVDAGEFADATNPTSQYTGLIGGQQFYTLTATNGACTNSDGVIINVRVPIKVPNAFTPNADNLNDVLNIEGLDTYEDVVLEIFNRWGSPVYKSVGTYIPWDGYRGGEAMPVATYYYILTVDGGSEDEQVFNGSVTLVR